MCVREVTGSMLIYHNIVDVNKMTDMSDTHGKSWYVGIEEGGVTTLYTPCHNFLNTMLNF